MRPQSAQPKGSQKGQMQNKQGSDKQGAGDPNQQLGFYKTIQRRLNSSTSTPLTFQNFKTMHDKQAHIMQRQLNVLENENMRKQKELEACKQKLEQQKQLIQFYQKFNQIQIHQDMHLKESSPENIMKAIHQTPTMISNNSQAAMQNNRVCSDFDNVKGGFSRLEGPRYRHHREQSYSGVAQPVVQGDQFYHTGSRKGIQNARSQTNHSDLPRTATGAITGANRDIQQGRHEHDAERDASFNESVFEKINMDEGIANKQFQPSKLLEKKMSLIQQLKDSRLKYFQQQYEKQQYIFIHQRFESQLNYERAMIRELDPYFKFQEKINPNLTNIRNGRDQRLKIYDQKIRQMRQQLRDKKNFMAQQLRQKCIELAELEKMNKKQKTKMIGGGGGGGGSPNQQQHTATSQNSQSVGSSRTMQESQMQLQFSKKSEQMERKGPEVIPLRIYSDSEKFRRFCMGIFVQHLTVQRSWMIPSQSMVIRAFREMQCMQSYRIQAILQSLRVPRRDEPELLVKRASTFLNVKSKVNTPSFKLKRIATNFQDTNFEDTRSKFNKSGSKFDGDNESQFVKDTNDNLSRHDQFNFSSMNQRERDTRRTNLLQKSAFGNDDKDLSVMHEDDGLQIAVKMENAVELQQFLRQSIIYKKFICFQKAIKNAESEAVKTELLQDLRRTLKQTNIESIDFRDKYLRIQNLLNQKVKPTKGKGAGALPPQNQSSSNAQSQPGDKQTRIQKFQEGEKQSEEMLFSLKQQLDYLFNLKLILNEDEQIRINELVSDHSETEMGSSRFETELRVDSEKQHLNQYINQQFNQSRKPNQLVSVTGKQNILSNFSQKEQKLPLIKEKSKKPINKPKNSKTHKIELALVGNQKMIPYSRSRSSNLTPSVQDSNSISSTEFEGMGRNADTDVEDKHYQKSTISVRFKSKRKQKEKMKHRNNKLLDKVNKMDTELGKRVAEALEMKQQYLLLQEVKANAENIGKVYNQQLAQDTIKDIEFHELYHNSKEKRKQIEQMKKELLDWRDNVKESLELDFNTKVQFNPKKDGSKDFEGIDEFKDQENFAEEQAAKERQMFDWVLMRYSKSQSGKIMSQYRQSSLKEHLKFGSKNNIIRMFLNKKLEIQKKRGFSIYDIEQMRQEHEKHHQLVLALREQHDRVRLQCKESTNTFAFRIHCIFDASDIEYPDPEIETIIKRYQRFWPFEQLDYDNHDHIQHQGQSSQQIMKNLDRLEQQKKRQTVKQKKKMIQKGLTDFQVKMMNTSLWQAFLHKIEINIYFVHQRKFVVFLISQIKQLRKPPQAQFVFMANQLGMSGGGNQKKPPLLKAQRDTLPAKQFLKEYKRVIDVNKQNLKEMKQGEQMKMESPQEAIISENLRQQEEKYFKDVYLQSHIVKKQAYEQKIQEQARLAALKKKRIKVIKTKLTQKKLTSNEQVLHAVNQDKSIFRKLVDFDRQDTIFIQNFMQNVNEAQQSDILKVPHQAICQGDQMAGSERGLDKQDGHCCETMSKIIMRSDTLLAPTQASLMKGKDSDKFEMIPREEIIRQKMESKKQRLKFFGQKSLRSSGDRKGISMGGSQTRAGLKQKDSFIDLKSTTTPKNIRNSDFGTPKTLTNQRGSRKIKFKKIQIKGKLGKEVYQTGGFENSSYDKMEALFQDKIAANKQLLKNKKTTRRRLATAQSHQRLRQFNQDIRDDMSYERPPTSILKKSKQSAISQQLVTETQSKGQEQDISKHESQQLKKDTKLDQTSQSKRQLQLKEEVLAGMQDDEEEMREVESRREEFGQTPPFEVAYQFNHQNILQNIESRFKNDHRDEINMQFYQTNQFGNQYYDHRQQTRQTFTNENQNMNNLFAKSQSSLDQNRYTQNHTYFKRGSILELDGVSTGEEMPRQKDSIGSQKKIVIDRLFDKAQTEIRPRKQWYLAASDEYYSDFNSEMQSTTMFKRKPHHFDKSSETFVTSDKRHSVALTGGRGGNHQVVQNRLFTAKTIYQNQMIILQKSKQWSYLNQSQTV